MGRIVGRIERYPQIGFIGDQNNLYPSPLAFLTQSWDACCLLQVARTEGQYCMDQVEEAKLNFSFFKSRQNATKSL